MKEYSNFLKGHKAFLLFPVNQLLVKNDYILP